MREEEQRGSAPEPCPAGLRARPPRFPPAPPTRDDGDSAGEGAVPESVKGLCSAFAQCLSTAGTLRVLTFRRPYEPDVSDRPTTLEETRQELLGSIEELRARLLVDPELSEPLLRLFQDRLLFTAADMEPPPGGTMVELHAGSFAIRYTPGLPNPVPWDWRQFPLAGELAVQCFTLAPRVFFREILDQTAAAVRDPASYRGPMQFDEAVARRLVASYLASVAVRSWVRRQIRTHGPGWAKL